jgi:formate hydrogenlyase transcriptional activator
MSRIQNSARTLGARSFRRSRLSETSSLQHQSPGDGGPTSLERGSIAANEMSSYRPDFEEFMSGIAAALTNAPSNQFPAILGACLKHIVEHGGQLQTSQINERCEVEHQKIELSHKHDAIIGQSDAIRSVLRKVEQVAPMDSAVLILGETGTGKELIARTIHDLSKRRDRQMIRVNCAAVPATLFESELFGREKGAFTGALSREIGRFELADRSTIFLDEIGEMPLEVQAKLLRVLQDGEFERLGSSRTIHVQARVITATNRDLQAAVREGKFREDLYYRLNVFPIEIPPLRERREDIPALVWHSIRKLCKQMGREIESIHPATMKAIQEYSWPGNVRELGNLIERHLILNPGPVFRAEVPRASRPTLLVGERLEDVERHHILMVLRNTNWRIRGTDGAADILGVKPTTLEARMKKLGITRPQEFIKRQSDEFEINGHRNIA